MVTDTIEKRVFTEEDNVRYRNILEPYKIRLLSDNDLLLSDEELEHIQSIKKELRANYENDSLTEQGIFGLTSSIYGYHDLHKMFKYEEELEEEVKELSREYKKKKTNNTLTKAFVDYKHRRADQINSLLYPEYHGGF